MRASLKPVPRVLTECETCGDRSGVLLGNSWRSCSSVALGSVLRRAGGWRRAGHGPVLLDLPPPGTDGETGDVSSLPVLNS